jgi:hypothetical protein
MATSSRSAYILADRPTTLEALVKTEAAIASFSDILGSLKSIESTDRSFTTQPELFGPDSASQSMNFIEDILQEQVFKPISANPSTAANFALRPTNAFSFVGVGRSIRSDKIHL